MLFSAWILLAFSRGALLLLLVLCSVYTVYQVLWFLRRLRSPLRHLPGPEPTHWLWGSMKEVLKDDSILEDWAEMYGSTFRARVLLGNYKLYTIDPRALSHILSHTEIYPKPEHLRHILGSIVGQGVLVAEGDVHRRQRKIMNPSFSTAQIREVTPIFFDTAHQLRDVLNHIISHAPSKAEGLQIDMFSWVGRTALDIIGQAGFGYRFNALHDETNELFLAVKDMIDSLSKNVLLMLVLNRFKILRQLPLQYNRNANRSMATTHRIGMELVQAKKDAVRSAMADMNLEKSSIVGRDLLSSLIRANMAADLPPQHRMSDEEVLAQISTFIVAGHETTASGLAWTLLSLAQNPAVQDKLRAEVSLVSAEAPSMDELNALPYLDMVVKESLRYHCPVRGTVRVATRADQIPLSKPVVDRNGQVHEYIQVQAGDSIGVESVVINHAKEFWGEDADIFRPERWEGALEKSKEIPGIYAYTMAFIGGPRGCIGYRFSVVEMKAILFTLIRSFDFTPIEGKEIGMKEVIVIRPFVKGQKEKGMQLPLRVRRVQQTA